MHDALRLDSAARTSRAHKPLSAWLFAACAVVLLPRATAPLAAHSTARSGVRAADAALPSARPAAAEPTVVPELTVALASAAAEPNAASTSASGTSAANASPVRVGSTSAPASGTQRATALPDGFAAQRFQLLGNPTLDVRAGAERVLAAELGSVPYWKVLRGTARPAFAGAASAGEWKALVDPATPAVSGLWIRDGAAVAQSVALYAPSCASLAIELDVSGRASVEVVDGAGHRFTRAIDAGAAPQHVTIRGAELADAFGAPPLPRVTLVLGGADARYENVELWSELPAPDEAALRREIVAELDAFFATWSERALDTLGPRATCFAARDFDALSGAPIATLPKSPVLDAFWEQLLDAWEAEPRPAWNALLERYLADFFELALHPESGLPRQWSAERDVPLDDGTLEIHRHVRFLVELAERGPQAYRERARTAAFKIGELVLARGVLPDGSVAAAYRTRDGAPSIDTVPIRRLDVPAQLARIAPLVGSMHDPTRFEFGIRCAEAARDALFTLEYAHYWAGTWDHIDPGFDDNYGHYGERAVAMSVAVPGEPAFRAFALSGHARYAPLLALALRFGGNVAADQVRCWAIFRDLARLEPALREPTRALLLEAARNHFRGEQTSGGAWIDVTMQGFDPVALPVGDTGGVPQNLLSGLAHVYEREPEPAARELRALFAAVLLSTREQYKAPYGYVSGARRNEGAGAQNSASATLRFTSGLVAMLRALDGVE